MGLIRYVIALK